MTFRRLNMSEYDELEVKCPECGFLIQPKTHGKYLECPECGCWWSEDV